MALGNAYDNTSCPFRLLTTTGTGIYAVPIIPRSSHVKCVSPGMRQTVTSQEKTWKMKVKECVMMEKENKKGSMYRNLV